MTHDQARNLHYIASALSKVSDKLHLAAYNHHIPDLSMTYLREAEHMVRNESASLTAALAALSVEAGE